MKTVSIILPFKNAESWITETLSSIENQTYPNWEIIAVNDHSEDKSVELIGQFKDKYPTKIHLYNNPEKGIIPALQLALKMAQGTFVTRIDSDDIMPIDRLKLMVAAIGNKSKNIVTGKVKYFSTSEISPGYLNYEKWINARIDQNDHYVHIYRECVIASPNWLARRDELIAYHVFDNLQYPEDYHIAFNWYRNRFAILPIDVLTLYWREHPDRTSRNSSHYDQSSFFNLKINQFLDLELKNDERIGILGYGTKTKLISEILNKNKISYSIFIEGKSKGLQKNLSELSTTRTDKLLIAIYPENAVQDIIDGLAQKGFELGKNAWFV